MDVDDFIGDLDDDVINNKSTNLNFPKRNENTNKFTDNNSNNFYASFNNSKQKQNVNQFDALIEAEREKGRNKELLKQEEYLNWGVPKNNIQDNFPNKKHQNPKQNEFLNKNQGGLGQPTEKEQKVIDSLNQGMSKTQIVKSLRVKNKKINEIIEK